MMNILVQKLHKNMNKIIINTVAKLQNEMKFYNLIAKCKDYFICEVLFSHSKKSLLTK